MRLYVRTLPRTFGHIPMLKCAIEVLNTSKTRAMKKTVVVDLKYPRLIFFLFFPYHVY